MTPRSISHPPLTPAQETRLTCDAVGSRERLSELMGCDIRTVYRWQSGETEPRPAELEKIRSIRESLPRD